MTVLERHTWKNSHASSGEIIWQGCGTEQEVEDSYGYAQVAPESVNEIHRKQSTVCRWKVSSFLSVAGF